MKILRKIHYKMITMMLVLVSILGAFNNISFAQNISYYQDFGVSEFTSPLGWTIPNEVKNIRYDEYAGEPVGAPEAVTGVALHASASGPGDRPAYVDLDTDTILPNVVQDYNVFDFDLYLEGGRYTCNMFTMGNNQSNSFTNLENTFFALGNGDGVGNSNTLRYYNYTQGSWVTIPNMNNKWMHVKVYADFNNKKMAFDLTNADGTEKKTYGPFSFASQFVEVTPLCNRLVMSGFRSNGGSVTLNTWLDNFCISTMNESEKNYVNYTGIIPNGEYGKDYSFDTIDEEIVLCANNRIYFNSLTPETNSMISITAEFMIPELPKDGYISILSYNDDIFGNLMVDKNGALINQLDLGTYNDIGGGHCKLEAGRWYSLKSNLKLANSTGKAYNTFEVEGIFSGYDTINQIQYTNYTRNATSFKSLHLGVGGTISSEIDSNKIIFRDTLNVEMKNKKNIKVIFDSDKGSVDINGCAITANTSVPVEPGNYLTIFPNEDYKIQNVWLNDDNIKNITYISPVARYGCYSLPVLDIDATINIIFEENQEDVVIHDINQAPYDLDPYADWSERKLASEARMLQINDSKMAYRLFNPVNFSSEEDTKYPLVVFLRGDIKGYDNVRQIDDVSMAKALTSGDNATNFPCFIVAPQCATDTWDDNDGINKIMVSKIIELLIQENSSIDTDRIYLCGNSGGANVVLDMVSENPELYSAAVTISGIIKDTVSVDVLKNIPIWTFYSLDDVFNTVPTSNMSLVESLNSNGGTIYSTVYETGSHNIWYHAYFSPLFKWMFSQNKNSVDIDPHMDNIILDYNNSLNDSLDTDIILTSTINNDYCQKNETELGDIVTDAIRRYTDADIALINGCDLGTEIKAGQPKGNDIVNALPTKNKISVVELTGNDIMNLLTLSLGYYPNESKYFLQMSGISLNVDASLRPSQRITSVLVNGAELDRQKTYKVAITNRLLSNKLNASYQKDLNVKENYYQSVPQMLASYIREQYCDSFEIIGSRINIKN